MVEFQAFLDDKLKSVKIPQDGESPVYEDYDVYSEIVEQIKNIRNANNFTQKELANRCGLTQANISNIENGIKKPTIESLRKIANAMDRRLRISFEDIEELI